MTKCRHFHGVVGLLGHVVVVVSESLVHEILDFDLRDSD